jgi:hypothetical protein
LRLKWSPMRNLVARNGSIGVVGGQRRLTIPRLVGITFSLSPAFPSFFHKLIIFFHFFFLLVIHHYKSSVAERRRRWHRAAHHCRSGDEGRTMTTKAVVGRSWRRGRSRRPRTPTTNRSLTTLSSPSTCSGVPSESLKVLARPSTSRRIMICTRTQA